MESVARNKWEKRTWMVTTCKCLKRIKNNQKGKEFRAYLTLSVQPPLAIYICLCLAHTGK